MIELPTVTLKDGNVVANFCLPHSFEFEDGSVLPACNEERAKLGEIITRQIIHSNRRNCEVLLLVNELSDEASEDLWRLHELSNDEIQFIIVSWEVLEIVDGHSHWPKERKFVRPVDVFEDMPGIYSTTKWYIGRTTA